MNDSLRQRGGVATGTPTSTLRAVIDDHDNNDDYQEMEEDEERLPPKSVLAVGAVQVFLMYLYYSIIIPTSYSYTSNFDYPEGLPIAGIVVGATSFGTALVTPLYRIAVKKSFAGTLHLQLICMQIGSIIYSTARLAGSLELLIIGRIIGGLGSSVYPVMTYVCEEVGKKHRSQVTSVMVGVARSLGYALGPILAAAFVKIDFRVGELTVDKDTVPGWAIAILCIFQTVNVAWHFPRHGSKLLKLKDAKQKRAKAKTPLKDFVVWLKLRDAKREEGASCAGERSSEERPWKEIALHWLKLGYFLFGVAANPIVITGWEMAATKLIQQVFHWSIPTSALFIGGIVLTQAVSLLVVSRLTYRYADAAVERVAFAVCIGATLLMFQYTPAESGRGSWVYTLPYLAGSFILMNAVTIGTVLMYSHVSKVCKREEIEPMQNWMNVTGFLFRCIGAVLADYLGANASTGLFLGLLLSLVLGNTALHTQLLPVSSG